LFSFHFFFLSSQFPCLLLSGSVWGVKFLRAEFLLIILVDDLHLGLWNGIVLQQTHMVTIRSQLLTFTLSTRACWSLLSPSYWSWKF